MSDSFDILLKKLNQSLNQDTPGYLNEMLNNLGVSKTDLINAINNVDPKTLEEKLQSKEFLNFVESLPKEKLEELKKINPNNPEELYKYYDKLQSKKEGK